MTTKTTRKRQPRTEVVLASRHFGVHTPVRTTKIDVDYDELVQVKDGNPTIDELALIRALPGGFIGARTTAVLLIVDDTAVRQPKLFRPWGKYFDALSLTVRRAS